VLKLYYYFDGRTNRSAENRAGGKSPDAKLMQKRRGQSCACRIDFPKADVRKR
jgi:hypothetical protein